ncbi:PD-(D/E)XK nuclease family protein, partial [Candidatus Collinsella stercoripullorum]|uniref:PD-(D/E)XK nuclease family protein n=1 Tax=Candidatus Collinsella stercoripullorum TaxID=2838522 RepID=UPI0022DFD92C
AGGGTSAAGGALAVDVDGDGRSAAGPADDVPDSFTLVYPEEARARVTPAPRPPRDSYSYTSLSAELHADPEDRAPARAAGSDAVDALNAAAVPDEPVPGSGVEPSPVAACVTDVVEVDGVGAATAAPAIAVAASDPATRGADGDPTALGSAFHAAAQWLIETGADTVPAERVDALARYWGVTPAQRVRLEAALARWEASRARAELMAWPQVRAEVPFFSVGLDDAEVRARFGAYAEGAIDALATDPSHPGAALVIDYKTGGSPDETPERLREKHALQARVYADVLHRAGFAEVELRFVRVEVPDPEDPGEPQAVIYRL